MKFIPSNYQISLEQFGFIKDNSCWLKNSLILNEEEYLSLAEMINSTKGNLLYRATRDGFEAQEFHTRCDGKSNTITIKNNLNYVFGGYASSAWNSSGTWINDPNAFLFSLRRNGLSLKDKFMTKKPEYSLLGKWNYGPTFGSGFDIHICNQSNTNNGRNTYCGHIYVRPCEFTFYENASSFLAGHNNKWITTEIEVYHIL